MKDNELIYREDGEAKTRLMNEELTLLDLNEVLKDYPYIKESMEKENYIIENPMCSFFGELLYDNYVVGFVAYYVDIDIQEVYLYEIYVLPEYRGNGFLDKEIQRLLKDGEVLNIYEPNHTLINTLIKYGYAAKLNDYLVSSAIPLEAPADSYTSNTGEHFLNEESQNLSNLYDLNISAVLFLHNISSYNTNIIHYTRALNSDIINYDALEKRKELDSNYFDKIKRDMTENCDKFAETITELKSKLPKTKYDIEEIVGKAPQLSEFLEGVIEDNIITPEEAYQIQKQMTEEYENGDVLPEELCKRVNFLCTELQDDFDGITNELEDVPNILPKCGYCGMIINPSEPSCMLCGYNTSKRDLNISFNEEVDDASLIAEIVNNENLTEEEKARMIFRE